MGIAILQDNVIKYASQKMVEIYGYSVEEMLNYEPFGFLRVIHLYFVEMVKERASKRQLCKKDVINHYEVKIIRKTGEEVWIENYSKPINFNGRQTVLVTNIDNTELKRAEKELKNLSKLKSELLTRTSHELKTPTMHIKGYALSILN